MIEKNIAFIDAQNLHLTTTTEDIPWKIHLKKFRIYLEQKYHVSEAYYFIGCQLETQSSKKLYQKIKKSGFNLIFREHHAKMSGTKKGNVDCDIIFSIMEKMYRQEIRGKIILVSGDGDYKKLIDFLIREEKLGKILFPNQKKASSLYKGINLQYGADLSAEGVRKKLEK
jgi:uncharacterized LabA/DUF88 family protein